MVVYIPLKMSKMCKNLKYKNDKYILFENEYFDDPSYPTIVD